MLGSFIRKEVPQNSFTIVESETSTLPTPPLYVVNRSSTTHVKSRE